MKLELLHCIDSIRSVRAAGQLAPKRPVAGHPAVVEASAPHPLNAAIRAAAAAGVAAVAAANAAFVAAIAVVAAAATAHVLARHRAGVSAHHRCARARYSVARLGCWETVTSSYPWFYFVGTRKLSDFIQLQQNIFSCFFQQGSVFTNFCFHQFLSTNQKQW